MHFDLTINATFNSMCCIGNNCPVFCFWLTNALMNHFELAQVVMHSPVRGLFTAIGAEFA